jgi:hypothetical protein
MRTTLLIATIVAGFGLAACSGGASSQAIPAGSQPAAPMAYYTHHKYHIIIIGSKQLAASPCAPSEYYECFSVAYGKPTQYKVCVGIGNSCVKGTWQWSQAVYTPLHHHKSLRVRGSFDPNPSNPTTATLTERFALYPNRPPTSKIGVRYVEAIEACNPTPSIGCTPPADVGIIPIGGGG